MIDEQFVIALATTSATSTAVDGEGKNPHEHPRRYHTAAGERRYRQDQDRKPSPYFRVR